MKKTVFIIAIMALLAVAANAEELKLKIPVNKWRQLRSRLYSLEKENTHLKKELETRGTVKVQAHDLEKAAPKKGGDLAEIRQRLATLEDENNMLQKKIKTAAGGNKKVAALKKKNRRLKKRILAMRSGSVVISYTGESRGARAEFFRARHRVTSHVFSD